MFGLEDIWKFLWSIFLVLPISMIVHEVGHAFFVILFRGKVKFSIGRGKRLFSVGKISVHRIYFLDSFIKYGALKWSNRFTHLLVHAGGVLFNFGSVLILNALIWEGILPNHIIFYQFAYFSVWSAMFSLFPVDYGDGSYSDGASIYLILRYGEFNQLSQ